MSDTQMQEEHEAAPWSSQYSILVGVIGGMGPAASVLLYQYIVENQTCAVDSEHIPLLIFNNPEIPNNNNSVSGKGPSSIPAMIHTAEMLRRAGATHICMACNTAHAYAEDVQKGTLLPVLHMVKLAAIEVVNLFSSDEKAPCVGILATTGAMKHQIYHRAIEEQTGGRVKVLSPSIDDQLRVQGCIDKIKAGQKSSEEIFQQLKDVAMRMVNQGAKVILLGCTELPLVLSPQSAPDFPVQLLDPMVILAQHIIQLTLASHKNIKHNT